MNLVFDSIPAAASTFAEFELTRGGFFGFTIHVEVGVLMVESFV